ncbi:MAG: HAMP domain-containing histidine kinase [Planctomycetes bacterium]|nr:HAMP domain-containing histidine kinase [Planctomycetota bacterium]
MPSAFRKLYSYGAVVALYVLVFGWWLFFFANQGDFLVERVARQGIELEPATELALRSATQDTMRMFVFEGAFLGVLLLGSMMLVVRALQRELALNRQQRNFLSAITHELRSPIASAKLYLESLLLGRAEGEKRERYLKHAHQDLLRLQSMVDSLLQTARLTTKGIEVDLVDLELASELRKIAAELAQEPQTSAAAIELAELSPLSVAADPSALRTILRNLVANAVKYAGPKSRVRWELWSEGAFAVLLVRDFGAGLRDADPKRLFEAFVRGGDEDVRTRPGVGLGLYLVAELAKAQGGSVRARTELEGGGFGVELRLPLAGGGAR